MLNRLTPFRRSIVSGVGVTLGLGLGWLVLDQLATAPIPEAQPASTEAKLSDRLGFVEEDVPVRHARIFDTLAMFSLPVPEAQPWSGRRVPTLAALEPGTPTGRGRAAMPRMVVAERAEPRITPAASAARLPEPAPHARAASVVASAATVAPEEREPISLLGWDVPGTQHLPGRKDAVKTAAYLGDKAKRIGTGTVSVVSDAASVVGDTVSSVGSTVAEKIGLR